MTDPFERLRAVAGEDASPAEVLAAAGEALAQAAHHGQPTLLELDGAYALGWHPLLGRFRVAGRMEGAPGHLPAWLAALDDAPHVHAGGDDPDAAIAALLALVQATSARL